MQTSRPAARSKSGQDVIGKLLRQINKNCNQFGDRSNPKKHFHTKFNHFNHFYYSKKTNKIFPKFNPCYGSIGSIGTSAFPACCPSARINPVITLRLFVHLCGRSLRHHLGTPAWYTHLEGTKSPHVPIMVGRHQNPLHGVTQGFQRLI